VKTKTDPLRARYRKVEVRLPHQLHLAIVGGAEKYKNNVGDYCAVAIMRQALDDQLIKVDQCGFVFSEGAK
jgi:hypothetical protein